MTQTAECWVSADSAEHPQNQVVAELGAVTAGEARGTPTPRRTEGAVSIFTSQFTHHVSSNMDVSLS